MPAIRVALANLRCPVTPGDAVRLAVDAIAEAGRRGALVICFPECYVPGYRAPGKAVPPPDAALLERSWSSVAGAAARANVAVVLGTERLVEGTLLATALVIDRDGRRLGFQDKVQIDPSEEGTYGFGEGRQVFTVGPLTFGVAICHEGWRYPEAVRWAARRGAQVVFHPHFHEADPPSPPSTASADGGQSLTPARFVPESFADPRNTFHEKAMLCRAAENTIYFVSVNHASAGSPTTSAVIRPEGTLQCHQPYGVHGVLVADLDLDTATGLLASRCRDQG